MKRLPSHPRLSLLFSMHIPVEQIKPWKTPGYNYMQRSHYAPYNKKRQEIIRGTVRSLGYSFDQENLSKNPIFLDLEFLFKKPKKPSRPYPSRSDLTNCQKLLEDSFTGFLYKDDSQVIGITSSKRWAEEEGINCTVYEIVEDPSLSFVKLFYIIRQLHLYRTLCEFNNAENLS